MKVSKIAEMPTVISNTHESCYKAYQTLMRVHDMLKRGDSNLTVLEFLEEMEYSDINPNNHCNMGFNL